MWQDGALGARFEFAGLISGDTVAASLQVKDGAGAALQLVSGPVPIPLPAGAWLLLGALGLLGGARLLRG